MSHPTPRECPVPGAASPGDAQGHLELLSPAGTHPGLLLPLYPSSHPDTEPTLPKSHGEGLRSQHTPGIPNPLHTFVSFCIPQPNPPEFPVYHHRASSSPTDILDTSQSSKNPRLFPHISIFQSHSQLWHIPILQKSHFFPTYQHLAAPFTSQHILIFLPSTPTLR